MQEGKRKELLIVKIRIQSFEMLLLLIALLVVMSCLIIEEKLH